MPRLFALVTVVGVLGLPFWWLDREIPSPSVSDEIAGEVHDDQGSVAGAIVRIKGRADFTTSDEQGRFRLPRGPTATRVTGRKDGYFIAGTSLNSRPLLLQLARIPEQDCERYDWVDPTPDPARPSNCGNCHQAIYDEWQRSGHARATTNRRFLDLYGDLLKEHPLGADVCSSCHAPTQKPGEFGTFDARSAANGGVGLSGVHCDYCHKVQGPGPGEWGLTHGRYQLALLRPDPVAKHTQLFFGPLDDVDRGEDVYSRFQRDSRMCAACHEGVVFGVPVYTTYSEWQASPAARAGRSCASCHMTPTGMLTNIAPGHGGIHRDAATLGNHRFFEGSQVEMLRRCLKLESSWRRTPADIEVTITLTATAVGHRVPTGFIDRHLILFVDAFAGERALPAYHGPTLSDAVGADEAGRAGRLYARFLGDGKNAGPVPFWKGDPATLIDTRLWPGETDRLTFRFPPETQRVRIRIVHRRFWKKDFVAKKWPPDDELILDNEVGER